MIAETASFEIRPFSKAFMMFGPSVSQPMASRALMSETVRGARRLSLTASFSWPTMKFCSWLKTPWSAMAEFR